MQQKFVVTIPMYVYNTENNLYDHPTRLTSFPQDETCSRLLTSLLRHKPEDSNLDIILLYGRTDEDIENQQIDRLFIEHFQKTMPAKDGVTLSLLGADFITQLESLAKAGFLEIEISNKRYGNIRNLQLLIQSILRTPYQINLDDDEIVIDSQFFSVAKELEDFLATHNEIGGVGGLYVDAKGSPNIVSISQNVSKEKNFFKQKEQLMQKLIDLFKQQTLTSVAPTVFGGLTMTTKRIAEQVCYDSYIPRGEDIDYLINAQFKQLSFAMRNDWNILHKPPGKSLGSSHIPTKEKQIRDVQRFLYEKAKINKLMEVTAIKPEDVYRLLQPYPGPYLEAPFDKLIADGSIYVAESELHAFLDKEVAQHLQTFMKMLNSWSQFSKRISNEKKLRESLMRIV